MAYVDSMNLISSTLEKHLSTKTVIGDPVTVGEVTMIPVVDVMFGFGSGGGEGKAGPGDAGGTGGGGGGGARLSAKAVIVIKGGEVQVLPLARGSAIEKIFEAIPGLVEKLQACKAAKPEAQEKAE